MPRKWEIWTPSSGVVDVRLANAVTAVIQRKPGQESSVVTTQQLCTMATLDRVALAVTRKEERDAVEIDWDAVLGVGTVDFTESLGGTITAHLQDFAFDKSARSVEIRKALARNLIAKAFAQNASQIEASWAAITVRFGQPLPASGSRRLSTLISG